MEFSDLKGMFAEVKARMDGAIDRVRRDMAGVRTGRAAVSLLDGVQVDAYGAKVPVNQVATLSVPEPAMIVAQPFDPSLMSAIEKAIRASDLGLNPANDGRLIRIPIPALNEERRQQLARHVHKVLEDHRTAVRNIRRDGNDTMKKHLKNKEMSEDDEHRALDEVQKLTNTYIAKLDEVAKAKEEEILTV